MSMSLCNNIPKYKILLLTNIPSPYMVDFLNELGKYSELTAVFERGASSVRDKSWNNWKAENFKAIVLKGINIGKTHADMTMTISQKRDGSGEKINIGTSQADMALSPQVIKYINKSYDRIIVGNPCTPTGILACYYMNLRHISYGFQSEGAFPGTGKGIKEFIKKSVFSKGKFFFSTAELEDKYYMMYGAKKEAIKWYPFTSLHERDILSQPLNNDEKKEIRHRLNIPYEKVVISVGRLIPNKGYDVLIKSLKNFSDNIGIYIIGGEPSDEYIKLRNESNENIHFISFQDRDSIKEYYKMADVFAINTRLETWGLFVNEALAFGIPVITTNRCFAALAMIEDGAEGYILPVDDERGFHIKINELLDNDSLREEMAKKCLIKAQKYTIENEARCIVEQL